MANTAVETTEQSAAMERVTSGPERLSRFLHDTREEMRKVVTPTREDVQSSTVVVIITVFLFAAYFEVVDVIFGKGIDKLFLHLTKH